MPSTEEASHIILAKNAWRSITFFLLNFLSSFALRRFASMTRICWMLWNSSVIRISGCAFSTFACIRVPLRGLPHTMIGLVEAMSWSVFMASGCCSGARPREKAIGGDSL